MTDPNAAEHLKIAKRLHFQGHNDEAIREYRLVLEIEPENEDAQNGLRALGIEPPDPVRFRDVDGGSAVKTNFFVNQAKSSELPAWRTGPFKIVIGVLALLGLYGVYQGVMMFLNFDNIKALENVDAHITKIHTKEGGDTYADVKISNFNPGPVKKVLISYQLTDAKGNVLKDGKLTIATTIPAGDSRTFVDQDLGALKEKPTDVKQKAEALVYGPKPKKLADRVINKFIEATQKPDKETFSDFDEITQDADTFPPALVGMGRAYAARGDYKRAIEQYKKALECDPEDYNAHYYMAVSMYYNNDKAGAKNEIEKAAKLAPDDPLISYSQKSLFAAERITKEAKDDKAASSDE